MSSRALNTSDAEMLLCCLEVETSCALVLRQNPHDVSERYNANIRGSYKCLYQQKKVDVDVKGQSIE